MDNYDLSILIPARNEMFLAKTVERLLATIKGKTEIIVGLDGQWADPPIVDDPRVTVVFFPESIGQRAATNQLARLSKAKYVMKLDAHCEFDVKDPEDPKGGDLEDDDPRNEGFDVILIRDMQEDWTVLPAMRNLHGFDFTCIGENPKSGKKFLDQSKGDVLPKGCGHRIYQCPTPEKCPKCGGNMEREMVWVSKSSPRSRSFMFDKDLHFQYWKEYMKRDDVKAQGEMTETLSAQGSCFIISRQRYWDLDICDEGHGSWGQQGTEVACKTWLSGGKLMVNNKVSYAHLFRTQGGDFGFPYHISGRDQDKARAYSRKLWLENTWSKRVHDFSWLLDKFNPIPDWHTPFKGKGGQNAAEAEASDENLNVKAENLNIKVSKGIIFYTDNQLNHKIAHAVQDQLRRTGLPIVSASLKPMPHFGTNIHLPLQRGMETYFKQIIAALEASTTDIIFFCEHDVIYHPSHFKFTPEKKDMFYYNQNFWRVRADGFAVHWDANQVSGLVCYRQLALDFYRQRLADIQRDGFNRSYEPGGRDASKYQVFKSEFPNIDIRHEGTLTKSKWSPNDFRDKSTCVNWQESTLAALPGWNEDTLAKIF